MFQSLAGRVAIVTGASKGIGKGMAKRFADAGVIVMTVSRNRAEAEQAARDIGGDAFGFAADVSDPASTVAMAEFCLKQTGQIDILAANAGIFPPAPLATMTAEQFDHVMHTNMRGTFLSVKSCLPAMTAQKDGRIILTSSITGPITGFPGWAHYGASKAAQLGFMRTAAIELAPLNITCNAIGPGNIYTEGLDGMGQAYLEKMEAAIPMRRLGSIEDIANAALFLASREASYITGQMLVVDGGQILPESQGALDAMA